MSEVPDLVDKLDDLFNKTDAAINIQTFSDYSRKLTRKTVYGNTGRSASTFDLVDVKDLVNSISDEHPKEVENVIKALDKVVIYSRDNMANTNGRHINFYKRKANIIKEYASNSYPGVDESSMDVQKTSSVDKPIPSNKI